MGPSQHLASDLRVPDSDKSNRAAARYASAVCKCFDAVARLAMLFETQGKTDQAASALRNILAPATPLLIELSFTHA